MSISKLAKQSDTTDVCVLMQSYPLCVVVFWSLDSEVMWQSNINSAPNLGVLGTWVLKQLQDMDPWAVGLVGKWGRGEEVNNRFSLGSGVILV